MKKKKNECLVPNCPYCGKRAIIKGSSEIFTNVRKEYKETMFYVCPDFPACNSYVKMDINTKKPLGVMADGELRNLRIKAHRAFDRLYKENLITRTDAYRWLSGYFLLPIKMTHIGMFGEYYCNETIRISNSKYAYLKSVKG